MQGQESYMQRLNLPSIKEETCFFNWMASDRASPDHLPEYLREEPTEEFRDIIASLPSHKSWLHKDLHLYQGFWYHDNYMAGVLAFQKRFEAQHSDVLLASPMKTGTTWMKALLFSLMNRRRFLNIQEHPLLQSNPHALVLTMEMDVYGKQKDVDLSLLQSPRLFSTHLPFVSLPASLQDSNCKIIYIGRDPKDTFVSLWHFTNKLRDESMEKMSLEASFDMYCMGVCGFGPVWEHVLSYWKESLKRPNKILFLKFEEMKENPVIHTRRLAEFMGFPFSLEEERQGLVDDIIRLCSFENLSQLRENKVGMSNKGIENNVFFRTGNVGDWKNYLTQKMVDQIDSITAEKFRGTGLKL